MHARTSRRLGPLAALLAATLLVPTAASATTAAPAAWSIARVDDAEPTARTSAREPVEVRDLSDACPEGRVPRAGFRDVDRSSPFARAIDCLVGFGITQGRTATTYAPNDAVTRQQMAVFLHRMLDDLLVLPVAPSRSRFTDVDASGEIGRAINVLASDELATLSGIRIVAGRTASTFDPGAPVTRAQMASFIARATEAIILVRGYEIIDRGDCSGVFRDERTIPAAHAPSVTLLCAAGIVTGRRDGTYGPHADVTRGQMAAFLMRLMDSFVEGAFTTPADRRSELFVDRGMAAAPCDDAGRDGTRARPFCTLPAAVDAASRREDHAVRVTVLGRAGQPRYEGGLLLESWSAHSVDLVGAHASGGRVALTGPIEVAGHLGSRNTLGRIEVTSPTAIEVRSRGYVALADVRTGGGTGVRVTRDGQGYLGLLGADLRSATRSVDLVGGGTVLARGSRFANVSEAYVVAPAGWSAGQAGALFGDGFLDGALGNRFDPAPTQRTLTGGRHALVPVR
jgi:hypothetical protein